MKHILKIYCDGACSGNPGDGGWGAVLIWQHHIKQLSGFAIETTNNRMELTAAIQGLMAIKKDTTPVAIYTDSQYLCKGMNIWIKKWKLQCWKNGQKAIKNVDLWQQLDMLQQKIAISWYWIKGHSGDKYNDIADKLARDAIVDGKRNRGYKS